MYLNKNKNIPILIKRSASFSLKVPHDNLRSKIEAMALSFADPIKRRFFNNLCVSMKFPTYSQCIRTLLNVCILYYNL